MNANNRVALLLAVIFVLLVIIVGIARTALTSGQLQEQYAPTLNAY